MKPTIIYDDENILILDKPSGMVVHPFDYSTEYTVLDFLHEYYPSMFTINNAITLQDGRTISLGGIVHKLDRETSGVMVIAKTQHIFDELQSQFKNHTTKKKYTALVDGILEKDSFTIDAPLGRSKKDYKQSTNPSNPRGELRSAVTNVHIVKRNTYTTLVELSPTTGRTHQLRAHMSSINHPIVGDKAYGSTIDSPRIRLHAQSISFTLNNKDYTFETPVPDDVTFETIK